jgi:hypothetical protein
MTSITRKYAVCLMLDQERHAMLRAARDRRFSMSEVVREAVDRLMHEIGYPDKPDWEALDKMIGPPKD